MILLLPLLLPLTSTTLNIVVAEDAAVTTTTTTTATSTTSINGVLRGSVVTCLTRNPGVPGLSRTGSSGFFRGSVLGQDTSEPQPSTGKTQEDMNNVSCRRDMTEILLKAA